MGIIESTCKRIHHKFNNYKLNGFHKIYYFNGDIYKGYYLEGEFHDEGELYFGVKDITLRGTWLHGQFHGVNQLSSDKYTIYGTWEEDKLTNPVRIEYENGDLYEGDIDSLSSEIIFHGNGTYKQASGHVRKGVWKNNKFTGSGAFLDENNNLYIGEICNNKRHGQGKLTDHTGHIAEGKWINDLFNGHGTLVSPEYTCTGNFINSRLKEGKVIQTSTGLVREGQWDNGVLLSGTGGHKNYQGTYHGQWRNGKYNGKGVLIACNYGENRHTIPVFTYEGYFIDGQYIGPTVPENLKKDLVNFGNSNHSNSSNIPDDFGNSDDFGNPFNSV